MASKNSKEVLYMRKFVRLMLSGIMILSLLAALNAQSTGKNNKTSRKPMGTVTPADMPRMRHITNAQRKAAAARAAQRRAQQKKTAPATARPNAKANVALQPGVKANLAGSGVSAPAGPALTLDQIYFGTSPNYANSPLPQTDDLGNVIPGTGIRKFVDTLPGLNTPNDLGQQIPVAIPDTTTFPGSDYYEIGLVEYFEKMHADLPPTQLRGYVQLNAPTPMSPHYLGPLIVAQKDRPVRVKFVNQLPSGTGGNLFIPVDKTIMGAGVGSDGLSPYLENRATLHLHGGNTPWISDGTPHQWTVPAGDSGATIYPKGVSTAYVPDMFFDASGNVVAVPKCDAAAVPAVTTNCWPTAVPQGLSNDPGPGAMTFYYTNQQSARLMFYHDHAYGITRLNVYVGEAAGYLVQDQAEMDMVNVTRSIPALQIPLVIQDKTFVPPNPATAPLYSVGMLSGGQDYSAATTVTIDPSGTACTDKPTGTPVIGDQLGDFGAVIPSAILSVTITHKGLCSTPPDVLFTDSVGTGAAAFGSLATLGQQDPTWDSGLWGGEGNLWFPHTYMPNQYPDNPDGSNMNPMGRWDYGMWFWPPMTTGPVGSGLLVHGDIPCPTAAIPTQRCPGFPAPGNPDATTGDTVSLVPEAFMDTMVVTGTAYPTVTVPAGAVRFRILNAANDRTMNLSLFVADTTTPCAPGAAQGCEVKMVPAAPTTGWPVYWPTDGRDGGVPDPTTAGPSWIQIGNEAGFIPNPVTIPPTPIGYEYNRRSVTVLNVSSKSLMMGPAERADVIVDFTNFAGKTLILYNDAPAPTPAFDTRYDYYTGDPDQTGTGGAPSTLAGYGPNTRTIMQIVVSPTPDPAYPPANLAALSTDLPKAFAAMQPPPIVPQAPYGAAYGTTFPNVFARLQNPLLTFTPYGATAPISMVEQPKTIQELFELDYGRMNATLGTELPFTNFNTQTTIPLGYIDPPTEIIEDSTPVAGQPVGVLGDGTQIWQITHNGVDTHTIHFHLFNVQLLNRFGWDGTTRPPDPNEIGWKEAVRMNPLEIDYVALRPMSQNLPWPIPDSIRPHDVTMPADMTDLMMSPVDGLGNTAPRINSTSNFGWEYVWHCHLLGHEENDMMRPIVFQVAPPAPSNLLAVSFNGVVNVSFTDNAASETGFNWQKADNPAFTNPTAISVLPASTTPTFGGTASFTDTPPAAGSSAYYRVQAFSPNGTSAWVSAQMLTKYPLTITANNQTTVYGSALPAFTVTPTGLVSPDTLASLSFVQVCTTTATPTSPVGTYPIDCSASTINAPNYVVTYVPGTLTITPAAASVTPDPAGKVYGQADPALTGVLTGFLPSDNVTATYSRTAGETVGTYTISATLAPSAVLSNYTITYNTANFTITPLAASVTPNPATKVYGAPDPVLTGTLAGFLAADNVTATYTRTPGATVGTYTISAVLAPASVLTNYNITYNTANFTITPLAASVTPNPATKVYGTADPALTGTLAGFLAADGVTATYSRTPGETVGTYTISAVLAPASVLTNYNITYNTATFTITPSGPVLRLQPASLTFASPINVTSASQPVTVTNTGSSALIINSIGFGGANPGRFGQTNNCPIRGAGLASGASCTINVVFTPNSTTTRTATLNVGVAAPAVSGSVSLTGTTITPTVSVTPASIAFGAQPINTTSTAQTVTVTNTGLAPLLINGIALGGANPRRFAITNNNCPIGGTGLASGATCTFGVTFTPTRRVSYSATVTVRDNASPGSQVVTLTGSGQ